MLEKDWPAIVLVAPQMGENIGAAARAMLNFGLTRMRIVAPRDGWPNPAATAMASGAGRVLEQAGLFATTHEALADCTRVYATTARPRELTKPVLTPAEAAEEARAETAAGGRVAFLFGGERAGLANEDIALANAIVSVPVNPAFPSLNLAQCVLLLGYEWGRMALPPAAAPAEEAAPATHAAVERLARHFEEELEQAGFFYPPEKAPGMKRTLRNLFARLPLTQPDVQTLHGALRQLVRRRPEG